MNEGIGFRINVLTKAKASSNNNFGPNSANGKTCNILNVCENNY